MISYVWDRFVNNSQSCYIPGPYICIDEQLFPTKTRCWYIQFIQSKPDKYGQKIWLAVDRDSNYIVNASPYFGKDDQRPDNVRVADHVVLKLMAPYLKKGRNVTCDNFFTSMTLAKALQQKSTTIVGTMNRARREVPTIVKTAQDPLFSTTLLKHEDRATMTIYQGKPAKNVILLSTMHSGVTIKDNEKKTPETVAFYNDTKFPVDVLDQMGRRNSVKAGSRRWPVHTFYNILDLAAINSWTQYKKVTGINISRKDYLLRLSKELAEEYKGEKVSDSCEKFDDFQDTVNRRRCQVK